MSASLTVMQLLRPLRWTHLLVPLVPISMTNDLIHYPAPFMLGIPTDEKLSADILTSLPPDVTLVDLDVGRVILASAFANDYSSASAHGETRETVGGALRSQVLSLAESLGGIFGAAIYRDSWCSDSPLVSCTASLENQGISVKSQRLSHQGRMDYLVVRNICKEFIDELLSGKCCNPLSQTVHTIVDMLPSFIRDQIISYSNLCCMFRHWIMLCVVRRKKE